MDNEFKPFSEIKKLNTSLAITQKIHGSNAQILIYQKEDGTLDLLTGSRTRWITPEVDNYGFAAFVHSHKQEFIEKLGIGRHYGEWAGPGINSGEGLSQKTLVLFDYWKFPAERSLPPQTVVVPVLYTGPLDPFEIQKAMDDLKANGSKLVPGFMRPEGIVVTINGQRFKKVFDAEETKWTQGSSGPKAPRGPEVDYSHLLQPIRLEKLLSRDETFLREYPQSLPSIVKSYVADLIKEEQIIGTEDEVKTITKGASGQIFKFIRTIMDNVIALRSPYG